MKNVCIKAIVTALPNNINHGIINFSTEDQQGTEIKCVAFEIVA